MFRRGRLRRSVERAEYQAELPEVPFLTHELGSVFRAQPNAVFRPAEHYSVASLFAATSAMAVAPIALDSPCVHEVEDVVDVASTWWHNIFRQGHTRRRLVAAIFSKGAQQWRRAFR